MFKADGQIVANRLQDHVDMQQVPFKVSVVTGPSGSYREEDILLFLTSSARSGATGGGGNSYFWMLMHQASQITSSGFVGNGATSV